MQNTDVVENREQRLKRLGFDKASDEITKLRIKQKKLAIAYEHFRYVRKEKISEFNSKLIKDKKELAFIDIKNYEKTPPDNVLNSLENAQNLKCFDYFEVAYIREVKDPILFGSIKGCSDKFFIDQWDDDVKIEDILKENEG